MRTNDRVTVRRGVTTCVVVGCVNRTGPTTEHPRKPANVCYPCWQSTEPRIVLGPPDNPIAVGTRHEISRCVSIKVLQAKGVRVGEARVSR